MLAFDDDAEIILLRISVNPAAEFSFSSPSFANEIIQEMEAETQPFAVCSMQTAKGWVSDFFFNLPGRRDRQVNPWSLRREALVIGTHCRPSSHSFQHPRNVDSPAHDMTPSVWMLFCFSAA